MRKKGVRVEKRDRDAEREKETFRRQRHHQSDDGVDAETSLSLSLHLYLSSPPLHLFSHAHLWSLKLSLNLSQWKNWKKFFFFFFFFLTAWALFWLTTKLWSGMNADTLHRKTWLMQTDTRPLYTGKIGWLCMNTQCLVAQCKSLLSPL